MSPRDRKQPIVASVTFEEAVIVVQYIDPTDLKANGAQKHQTLFVPREDDYDDEIEAVESAVRYLIGDVEEDWTQLKNIDTLKRRQADESAEADEDDEDEQER